VPHSSRVGSQITGCSNLYPLNAPQRVSEIWLLVFTVSCFTVNKRAQKVQRKNVEGNTSHITPPPRTRHRHSVQKIHSQWFTSSKPMKTPDRRTST
jgi:hypothetical protein